MNSKVTFGGPIGFTRGETRAAALLGVLLLALLSITIYLRQTRPTEAVTMEAVTVVPAAVTADSARPAAPAQPTESLPVSTTVGGRLDLNTAAYPDLLRLPGVGPVLAARIIEYRNRHGGFESVAELTGVAGIGEVKLERLRSLIIVR